MEMPTDHLSGAALLAWYQVPGILHTGTFSTAAAYLVFTMTFFPYQVPGTRMLVPGSHELHTE